MSMSKLNVPPTKSNMLRLKRELATVREGYEMLEQKRKILVLELMDSVEKAKRAQEEVQTKLAAAFEALKEVFLRSGTLGVTQLAEAPQAAHEAEIESRSLMGLQLPTVLADHPEATPVTSLLAGSPALDEAAARFRTALESIDRLAEIQNGVFRLAREVRKTQRRVNALEKIFMPSYQETLTYILGTLEERERDDFVVMRLVKQRLEVRDRALQEAAG
jgi:V/A-type H+/Na+-transporting ATPase subunit D